MQQINVILPVAGAAQALVKFMSLPEAAPLIRRSGMEAPPR